MKTMSGRSAGTVVLGCCAAIFWPGALTFGFPGVMADYWRQTFSVGQGDIGRIIFFGLMAVGAFMYLCGRWQEKIGIRRMIIIGVTATSVNVLLAAFAPNMPTVYIWAFINGVASCFVYIPAITVVQHWYQNRRGLVTGVVSMTFAASAAVTAPLFTYLLLNVGYRSGCLLIAVVSLLVGFPAALLIDSPPKKEVSPDTDKDEPGEEPAAASLTVYQSLGTFSFWSLWAVWILQGGAGISMTVLATMYGLHLGYELTEAVILLTAFNLSSGLCRLVMGYLSDIVGQRLTMGLAFLIAGASYFMMPHASNLVVLTILAMGVGLGIGTMFSVSAPLTSECFGVAHFGAIFGAVFTGYGFIAGLIGPTLAGYLLDTTDGNFTLVFSYLGVFCLASLIMICFVRPPKLSIQPLPTPH